jgi:isopentenyl phosphate kinase
VLVKLGGSLITRKERRATARRRRIVLLARQIAEARRGGVHLLLGHGSGSFGHPAAAAHGLQHGITSAEQLAGVSRTQGLARKLHSLVVHQLDAAGALPFSLPPGAFLVADGGEPAEAFLEPIAHALELGLLPVVFGDVVTDRRQGVAICSTEAVFVALARALADAGRLPARALWLGDTPGVLDGNGRAVPHLDAERWRALRQEVGSARGVDVTGGMALRVETALALAELGVESWLLDGRPDRALTRALAGDSIAGTHVPSAAR